MPEKPIIIATRGSALALTQANLIFNACRKIFPRLAFEVKIIKTTGDKLQTASLAKAGDSIPKGLFTKELEIALIKQKVDLAVHSLKDLPTELPAGLKLGATPKREDVRDVLIYKDDAEFSGEFSQIRGGGLIGTSSTRREAQMRAVRPDLCFDEIRGNVPTRLKKLAEDDGLDGTILAAAGLNRLNFTISGDGFLEGDAVPDGIRAIALNTDIMLPCVGQGAIGVEIREDDGRVEKIVDRLNHFNTITCVTAERSFLKSMGGGCQSPVGAYALVEDGKLQMRAVSFLSGSIQRTDQVGELRKPMVLGELVADQLRS